jgi:2-dehydropantoate 2-reductase
MRIAVVGTGGVGGYFGSRLAASGSEVTFVARGVQFAALQQNGLAIRSSRGGSLLHPVRVVEQIEKVGPVDLVIIAVKCWDTEGVAQKLRPLVDQGASILSLQNGVNKDDVFRKYVTPQSILGGVCYIASAIISPGIIQQTGQMQRIVLGEYSGERSRRAEMFAEACQRAEIDVEITDSIERLIWEKFVFLVGISGATATMRQSIGPIRSTLRPRAFLLDVMREVVAVGRARGVNLREDFAEDRLTFCDSLPSSMTSSMQIDLERGSRLELPWLSGSVVELGELTGVPTPLNRAICDILALYANGRM